MGGASIGLLRRLLTILLLAVIGLPLAAPLFAATLDSASSLPACCRRDGKHHCMGLRANAGPGATSAFSGPVFLAPKANCPCAPTLPTAIHHDVFAAPPPATLSTVVQTHDTAIAQVECQLRISHSRSRQKRGPPATA